MRASGGQQGRGAFGIVDGDRFVGEAQGAEAAAAARATRFGEASSIGQDGFVR